MAQLRHILFAGTAGLLSLNIVLIACLLTFPQFHDLDSDFNFWNVSSRLILEGEHHHSPNPAESCIDYHTKKNITIEDCYVCSLLTNYRTTFTCSFQFVSNEIANISNLLRHTSVLPSSQCMLLSDRAPPCA